ncbi:MAG: Ig-like domain-containing protein [Saprospiraceae bacterium]|nr:Ig-like domain-containing protein [Saprospiraceae bacterium]HRG33854.1 glucoamylase family protein [Saprospiraceae bacterium]
MFIKSFSFFPLIILFSFCCTKKELNADDAVFKYLEITLDGQSSDKKFTNVGPLPKIKFNFSEPIDTGSARKSIFIRGESGLDLQLNLTTADGDSTLWVSPLDSLAYFTSYDLYITSSLKSISGKSLESSVNIKLITSLNPNPKPIIMSDDSLLTEVQQKTFKYFWDFGHPVSGLSRERNTSGDICTLGGSGFGIMSILVGMHRKFISREDGLNRLILMTNFLSDKTTTYHGAFPHWFNGSTGATVPFSPFDDGADLVETSYLMMGLLCARQFFKEDDILEKSLRDKIDFLFNRVEWSYFQKNEEVLYWHWSEKYGWKMNFKIQGWNEALITYVLAASSELHAIPRSTYVNGWAKNGGIKNGNSYYGYTLPLGPTLGGPLFFEHYSFLGMNPNGLKDEFADYEIQTKNHSLINYAYCVANPKKYFGYSADCWGLTASDTYGGYTAHEPNNDRGVISPTAAISSLPFTPDESLKAMRFFYHQIGNKTWKEYGFIDAFSLDEYWFANSFLAIDQGPIIVMIENYRSGLLWNLFTSCPEVKSGMKKLGFKAPYL